MEISEPASPSTLPAIGRIEMPVNATRQGRARALFSVARKRDTRQRCEDDKFAKAATDGCSSLTEYGGIAISRGFRAVQKARCFVRRVT